MTENLLEKLKVTDFSLLSELVRQDQHSPEFAITNWTVELLSHKGFGGSEGQFLFHGHGFMGETEKTWSLVLKIQKEPLEQQPTDDYFYWRRELLTAQSEWLAHLPGPVRAQRIYRATEEDGFAWLWMEYLYDTIPQSWTLKEYGFAARQLGQWHGAYFTGVPQPDAIWLCRDHIRSWLGNQTPDDGWSDSNIATHFSGTARTRHKALWADLDLFLTTLNHLPQVFSHYDFQRRNLFICKTDNQQDEVVAIDWALCGVGPIGGDLFHLVGLSAAFFDFEVERIRDLETVAFAAYLDGLRSAGWIGDANHARLGYCIWAAAYCGAAIPPVASYFGSEAGQSVALQNFGVSGAELLNNWALMLDYCLDCADEARELMKILRTM